MNLFSVSHVRLSPLILGGISLFLPLFADTPRARADFTVTPNPSTPDETDAYEVKVDANGVEITGQTLHPPAPWRFKKVGTNAQGAPVYAKTTADPAKYLFTLPQNSPGAVQGRWRTIAGLDPMSADLWDPEMDGKLEQVPSGGGVGPPPTPPPDADWKVKVKGRAVLLGIDNTNTKGQGIPAVPAAFLDANKTQAPGKIVLCDLNDADNDGVPDYADQTSGGVANPSLVRLLVAVPSNADMNGVKVKFTYDGPADYVGGAWPSTALGRSNDFDYKDYRGARQGALRLWKLSSLVDDRKPDATSKKLIPSGKEVEAIELFAQATAYQQWKYVTLYVEGIKPASGNVSVQLIKNNAPLRGATDQVAVTSAELALGFNNENQGAVDAGGNLASTDLLPGTPDVKWKIDEFDQVTKDQGRGYPLWTAQKLMDHKDEKKPQSADGEGGMKDVNGSIDPMEIEGTHPMVLKVPDNIYTSNLKIFVRAQGAGGHTGFLIYKGVSPRGDLLAYHRNTQMAQQQSNESAILTVPNQWVEIPKNKLQAGDNVLVLKNKFLTTFDANGEAVGGGEMETERTVSMQVAVAVDATDATRMSGDQTKCWYGDNFYETWNLWASQNVVVSSAPQAPMPERNHYNSQAKYVLAHTHGYNYNSLSEAKAEFDQYYRRFYRAGFRGNYVTITWPSGDASELAAAIGLPGDFDKSTINGFKSAPFMLQVLRNSILTRAGGAQNVDFYTHSHGNLPLWQMLKASNGTPLFHNVFGSEAAVWMDGLMSPDTITYKDTKTEAGVFPDRILGPGALDSTTWSDWWGGRGLAAIQGKYFHGYNHYDDALWNKMRVNEWMKRESGAGYPTWLAGVSGGPGLVMMVGGTDFTCKDADERSRAELGNYYVAHTIGAPRPQVHLALQGAHLTQGALRVENATAGVADDQENQLSVEVPDLLDMRYLTPDGQRMDFEASASISPLLLIPIYSLSLDDYMFSHLRYAHGCGETPLGGAKVGNSYDMKATYNWSEWMHAGHRDQSYPAAWNFYSNLLFHHSIPGDWTIFKTGKDR